jgi:hypothetical protein
VITGVLVVFTTDTSGQFTVIAIGPDVLFAAFTSTSARTVAVFWIAGQFAGAVVAASVIVRVAPCVRVPNVQVSVAPPATGEAGAHAPASGPPTAHVSPPGSTSVSTTPVDEPAPPAVTVML